ncbi:MAG: ATP-binding protein [Pseudomonadota bacterium]|nr:ATP-binding protein [Pseudomonadota bacterium]
MTEQNKELSFKLKQKEDLGAFMEALDFFRSDNELDYKVYFDLKICLEEVIINVFKHGRSKNNDALEVDVKLTRDDAQSIVAAIADNATPFNIVEMGGAVDFQATLEDRPIGGVGIHLVKNLSDKLEYEELKGGNKVIIHKRLSI